MVDGKITLEDGILTWEEIDENVPKIVIEPTILTLDTGTKYQMKATAKRTTETIHWDTSDHDIATISQTGEITTAASIDENTAQVDVIASATGCEDKICKLTVNKVLTASAIIPVPTNSATSAYVYYTMNGQTEPTLCRVLYNDSIHGLQIITAGSVATVHLGKNDDIGAEGTNGTRGKAQNSFNSAIVNLNNKAESYIDTGNNIVIDARCVGSKTAASGDAFTNKDDETGTQSNGHKGEDTNYTSDFDEMNILGIKNISNEYWLNSRQIDEYNQYYYIRLVKTNGSLNNDYLFTRYNEYDCYHGFRPVFLINPMAKIKSGDGLSAETAYILEAGN